MRNLRPVSVECRRTELRAARSLTATAWPVACEDFAAEPGFDFPTHAHAEAHACFVIDGLLIERDGEMARRMPAGTGRLSPGGDEHRLTVGPGGVHCLVLEIAGDFFDGSEATFPEDRRYVTGPAVKGIARRLIGELRAADDVSPVCLELLAIEAAALSSPSPGPAIPSTPEWLERVRDRIRDDLRSVPSLAELARDAGVSRARLARVFRARYGYTIGQYVRGQRLEAARRLILRTGTPLSAVAYEAGFADQSHMTRAIASRFGTPPGRLRTSQRLK